MNIKKSQQKIKSDGSYFCCHMHKKKDRVSSTLLRTRSFKSCFIKSSLSCIKLSDIVLYLLWWILCGNFILPNGYRPCLFLWNWICEINYTLSPYSPLVISFSKSALLLNSIKFHIFVTDFFSSNNNHLIHSFLDKIYDSKFLN